MAVMIPNSNILVGSMDIIYEFSVLTTLLCVLHLIFSFLLLKQVTNLKMCYCMGHANA